MKFVLAVFAIAFVACVCAKPVDDSANAVVLRYDSDINEGGYNYALETSDGISKQESGVVQNPGAEDEHIAVSGSYSYLAPDGQTISVNYIADTNGFQPSGDHIPQPQ